ncbi:MAG: hypothetical protein CVT64_05910 [Actinobacteria bacterium HGW-Actinobacteria-4]|nr:MAG: hypothetical protein CVT64_05910 [Actinobacteria bacterium HGW-Actinobacteria-4]
MTTNDVDSPHRRLTTTRMRRLKAGAVAIIAAFTLSACGSSDGYIDAWWDNGDPIYAPVKADLFDEDLVPTCSAPTAGNGFESRARPYSNTGGLVNLFLFEVQNSEPDPNAVLTGLTAREEQRERTRRERLQGSLETMYQMTHPDFDAKFGITTADDMAAVKAELAKHLADLDQSVAPIHSYVERGRRWLETPDGRLTLSTVTSVADFIEENNLPLQFEGLKFDYLRAVDDDGTEYLMVTDKETAQTRLYAGNEVIDVDESSELFIRYEILLPGFGTNPSATITLVNDQCPPYFGDAAARFWIYDYELLFPAEVGPIDLGFGGSEDDEATDDEEAAVDA